ncbi:hypothetical protein LQG66_32090 [Bradyrhizobium ontarionense]|uniref:Uncharacterized protein n=1 Tax=Bradyrhizobium ontarionense TaxID=2898149 RepID=A0ABY3R902_9BRAD|nr:hypothetical protein [Bradyrhizobium sp. A19]UFZ03796.1 hypothetical protein LQG66_32090 [Bradyrhizobium sp. A19]
MARLLQFILTGVALAGVSTGARADDIIGPAKARAYDARVFTKAPGQRAYACFTRRYTPDHLAQHPKQKVRAMQLLVTAEIPQGESIMGYSFRLGVNYRDRAGDFDSSGSCDHIRAEDGGHEIRYGCPVDCEGGGIEIAMSKDDTSAIVRLTRITVWQRGNKPDDDAADALIAGSDDKIFRLDRTDTADCAGLMTDRKELAGIRHK